MALLAIRGESRSSVVWIAGGLVVLSVAAKTVSRQVVTVSVTGLAVQAAMRSLQPKELTVVEVCSAPICGRVPVTILAIGWETLRLMIGPIVVVDVAADAIRADAPELTVYMAIGAFSAAVASIQAKPVVGEIGSTPSAGRAPMTRFTVERETGLLVVGISRAVVVLHMASRAVLRGTGVDAVPMTGFTIQRLVLTAQRKMAVMIQSSSLPSVGTSRVTRIAISGKSSLLVAGRGRTIVVVDVAGRAIGRQAGKLPIRVTVVATGCLMLTPEWEKIVLEDDRPSPVHRARMARFAFRWKTCGDMIRLLRVLVVRKVTSTALS